MSQQLARLPAPRDLLEAGRRHYDAIGRGVALSAVVAMAALFLANHYAAPVMLFALLLGMAFGFVRDEPRFNPGIRFSTRTLLRVGVALLGARLTLADLAALGTTPLVITVTTVGMTLIFGFAVTRLMGMRKTFGILSAGSVSICGASAALAIASTLPRSDRLHLDTVLVVVSVSTLSTVALVLYPIVAKHFGLGDVPAGIFLGATIHDVAQVVGAGFSVSETSGEIATVIKLVRVAMLLPLIVGLAMALRILARQRLDQESRGHVNPPVPWFLFAFLAIVTINSFDWLPAGLVEALATASTGCLITAVAALGMQSSIGEMLQMGWRPITVIVIQTVFMGVVGLSLVHYFT